MAQLSEEEIKKRLTPEQYHILREKGTEAPFSGELLNNEEKGMYVCPVCGAELFSSESKYESDIPGLAGWPSFADVVRSDAVKLLEDSSHGMHRTEVICANCGSHLGHLFDDSSSPSGQHYCINSASLEFKPKN
ncbi:MAG TPA: peptide-methionine (R)-S-oxide reductase MsrB [Candidatus Saccharimonadales bacterium]|nr:peptide-methionine (R)-S-oxide reductase MsrB [Candidatus Saccharimonadales bacterium]